MPTVAAQLETALAKLRLYAQPDVPPVIDTAELSAILEDTARATIWAAATAYTVGDVVLPTVRNGRRYRVTQAGTSGATEPTWSTSQQSTLTDGTSDPLLRWVEAGPDFDNVYNVRAAIHAVCDVKARKASALVATGNAQMQQVYDHWKAEADRTRPVGIA